MVIIPIMNLLMNLSMLIAVLIAIIIISKYTVIGVNKVKEYAGIGITKMNEQIRNIELFIMNIEKKLANMENVLNISNPLDGVCGLDMSGMGPIGSLGGQSPGLGGLSAGVPLPF